MKLPSPCQKATELLALTSQTTPPTDLRKIISLWPNLNLSFANLDNEGYFVDLGIRGGEIIVRSKDPLVRQRYTIAHEIGHWILMLNKRSAKARKSARAYNRKTEKWCDEFAAAILMPEEWTLKLLRKKKVKDVPNIIISGAKLFAVSDQAFRLRVSRLTPISIFEIKSKNRKREVQNKYESPHLKSDLVWETLSRIAPQIKAIGTFRPILDPETDFWSTAERLSTDGRELDWLLCILPRTMNQVKKV